MSAETAQTVQLSRGIAIEYKAYNRVFDDQQGAVLYLLASCYYTVGGYHIFFEAENGLNTFKLMEKVPGLVNQLVTYYVASWTSSQRLVEPQEEITIIDGHGSHTVEVEQWD